MLLGLGENLEGVVSLLAIFFVSFLFVLALLLNLHFLCCLHLLPTFSVRFFVL